MSEENVKTFTVRRRHWLRCAMHDPLVLPPAFDLAYCTISPLDAKTGRRFAIPWGVSLGEERWFVLVLGPFLARGASAK
jgi:hypothetical protein